MEKSNASGVPVLVVEVKVLLLVLLITSIKTKTIAVVVLCWSIWRKRREEKRCAMMIGMRIVRSAKKSVVLFEGMRGKPQTIKGKSIAPLFREGRERERERGSTVLT